MGGITCGAGGEGRVRAGGEKEGWRAWLMEVGVVDGGGARLRLLQHLVVPHLYVQPRLPRQDRRQLEGRVELGL